MVSFLDAALAVCVLAGFGMALWAQGQVAAVRMAGLSDADVGRLVVLTGTVRWLNGTRAQLCQGKDCVRVTGFFGFDAALTGRWVAVEGRWQDSGLLVASRKDVDVLG